MSSSGASLGHRRLDGEADHKGPAGSPALPAGVRLYHQQQGSKQSATGGACCHRPSLFCIHCPMHRVSNFNSVLHRLCRMRMMSQRGAPTAPEGREQPSGTWWYPPRVPPRKAPAASGAASTQPQGFNPAFPAFEAAFPELPQPPLNASGSAAGAPVCGCEVFPGCRSCLQ